mmetsp:Transcript_21437/g.25869  ORF Transcript_21437/g.25869 Transcript_21437/m.25869 type:complete len:174 (-) Transcript_21437:117-638(-)|eukprot:CAMPEP_0195255856 /NCGR_PEP_ID=MMETSP0706-20130129/5895_1 /TAXON_ID=33640 /ORGANISM="Asterionellopsis glacialis, Strain CCMP134" /LENGTH=173 /DNA_ID=CAMNT_0040308799 /DNA_START=197 /DNA_END=718 /DNA_ORIENTATION=-
MKVTSFSLASIFLLSTSFPDEVVSFTAVELPATAFVGSKSTTTTIFSDPNYYGAPEEAEDEEPKLMLDNLGDQMQEMNSKYPTSESAYLEASRKRAEAYRQGQLESNNDGATDAEWQQMADAKSAAMGDNVQDDWEASLAEAGNADSQILMFTNEGGDGGEDGEDEEPKLLLF